MNVLAARVGGTLGAAVWIAGVPLVGLAGVIPSDAEYSLIGGVGILLGCCFVPVALADPSDSTQRNWPVAWGWTGAALGAILVAASALLVLGARGDLGARAPEWVADFAGLALIAVFGWVLVASVLRGRSGRGRAVYLLGVVTGGTVVVSSLLSAVQAALFPNFTITNAAIPVVFLVAAIMWLGLPAWLLAVVWRRRYSRPRPG